MNTEQFRYFAMLYEERSYPAAAKRIPMSTHGLAKAIHGLEASLGVSLFGSEKTSPLDATPFADKLYEYVQRQEREWDVLMGAFDGIKAAQSREIRLGTSTGSLEMLGSEFQIGLARLRPRIDLVHKEFDDADLDKGLAQASFDIALAIAPFDKSFETEELFSCPVAFWMNKKNPLSQKETLCVNDLAGQNIIMPSRTYKLCAGLLNLCASHQVEVGEIYESNQMHSIFQFAKKENALGFTVSSVHELSNLPDDESVACVPFEDLSLTWGISYLPTHELSQSERRFIRYLKDFIARKAPLK